MRLEILYRLCEAITYLHSAAEATTDFVDNCLTIVCPVGSRTGDTAYVNITIVDDKLKEDREIFVVLATISSSNAAFGGGAGSSANITVTITDDDGRF